MTASEYEENPFPAYNTTQQGMEEQKSTSSPVITGRWIPLRVSSIESVVVINKKLSEEDEFVTIGGRVCNLRGSLISADLKIDLTMPYDIDPSCLSVCTEEAIGLSSKETTLRIGCNAMIPPDGTAGFVPADSKKNYTVIVPLVRGRITQKPLLDHVTVTEDEVVHHTILLPGWTWPSKSACTYRIRLSVNQLANNVTCTSVTMNAVDTVRLQTSWNNFSTWVRMKWKELFDKRNSQQETKQNTEKITQGV